MTAARNSNPTTAHRVLHVAFELGWNEWKLAFTTGPAQKPRLKTIAARDLEALATEIAKAKKRFALPGEAGVRSCYEAGRDGFWLHRYLRAQGIDNLVVDSASIEVNRRQRRAKSDRLDAVKLVSMLLRYHDGERQVWSVVLVPDVADEDRRQLHRELAELKDERTQHINRIKGVLASHGLALTGVDETLPERLAAARLWDGSALPADCQARLWREWARWRLTERHIKDLENERKRRVRRDDTPHVERVRLLLGLPGVGLNGAWLLVYEVFAWRTFRNRKQVGSMAGLTPTPFASGQSCREQGISKAGNRRLRRLLVELAWCWLRWQPYSALSQWYRQRFGSGPPRLRKIGVVAVARKLLIALWKYLERGEVPQGAQVGPWRRKLGGGGQRGRGGHNQDAAA
jgi:transposase